MKKTLMSTRIAYYPIIIKKVNLDKENYKSGYITTSIAKQLSRPGQTIYNVIN